MARINCMVSLAFLFLLFTCQMLSGDGRKIRSVNGLETGIVKSSFHRGIRILSSQSDKSDHNKKPPKNIPPQKPSAASPPPVIYSNNSPSLKPTHSFPRSSHKVDWLNKVDSIVQTNCLGAQCPDDFRPTAPGKSPGAGHSYVTNAGKTVKNQVTKNPNMWNSLAASEDDFRHTTPGRSPGAGHAEEDTRDTNLATTEVQNFLPSSPTPISFFSDPALVSTHDFRPTAPGSSPGAGHFDTNKIDIQRTRYCLIVKCTDGFRPSTRGDSPGAGQSLASNSNRITSEHVKHPSVAHPHAGGTDDYRPTKPGHSPGAGHAVTNKREPNS